MNLGFDNHRWYAVQVRTRWETSTSSLLSGKGYQTLLPTYSHKKSWSGRLKEVSAPLFPGYVFCRFDVRNRLPVLITPGVIAVVGRGKLPVPVEDGEIAGIQAVVSSGFQAEPWPFLELGQRVRIESEPLQGLEGILINFKGNHRIVLSCLCFAGRLPWRLIDPVSGRWERLGRPFLSPLAPTACQR